MDIFDLYKCYTWSGKDRSELSAEQRRGCAICPCPKCKKPFCGMHEGHACNAKKLGHELVCVRCCHPEDEMRYFLVGKPGADALGPGEATLIRRCRTPKPGEAAYAWSYLYWTTDVEWQKQYAPFPAHRAKHIFWGLWTDRDQVKGGRYPSVREITEEEALLLIAGAPAGART